MHTCATRSVAAAGRQVARDFWHAFAGWQPRFVAQTGPEDWISPVLLRMPPVCRPIGVRMAICSSSGIDADGSSLSTTKWESVQVKRVQVRRSHPRLLRQGNIRVIGVTSVMIFRIVEPQYAGFRTTSLICNPTHYDAAGCILLVFAPNPHPLTNPISTNIMKSAAESWSVGSAPFVVPGETEDVETAIHTGAAEGTLPDAGHLPIFLPACSLRIGGCECVRTCGRRDCAVVVSVSQKELQQHANSCDKCTSVCGTIATLVGTVEDSTSFADKSV